MGGSQLKRWINWQAGNKDNLITLQAPGEEKHGSVVCKICSEPNRKLCFADFESSFLRKPSLPPHAEACTWSELTQSSELPLKTLRIRTTQLLVCSSLNGCTQGFWHCVSKYSTVVRCIVYRCAFQAGTICGTFVQHKSGLKIFVLFVFTFRDKL